MTAPNEGRSGAVVRVLLADDNDLSRGLVARMLKEMGGEVDEVADGGAAVKAARQKAYHLIFLDGIMPVWDGLEATVEIRGLPGPNGRAPIVGITGNPVQIPKAACLEAGMDEYFQKPIPRQVYRDAVARWAFGRPRQGTPPRSSKSAGTARRPD